MRYVTKNLSAVRYYRASEYMGWQKYGYKMRFMEIRNWLNSDDCHSVRIGRLTISAQNIVDLPINERDL